MNCTILMGRLTRDVEVRYTQAETPTAIARYTLAVNRRFSKDGEQKADFINCIAFGKSAEFAEKYFHKGLKVVIRGRIQTGSYTNKDGQTVYTTDVVVEEQNFADSKASAPNNAGQVQQAQQAQPQQTRATDNDGFKTINDINEFEDDGLPFM